MHCRLTRAHVLLICVLHVSERVTQVNVYFDCVFTYLQANAFRSLRFLFSLERNRRLFKMLFTPQLFGQFIDVGHYHTELKPYYALVDAVNAFSVRLRCICFWGNTRVERGRWWRESSVRIMALYNE